MLHVSMTGARGAQQLPGGTCKGQAGLVGVPQIIPLFPSVPLLASPASRMRRGCSTTWQRHSTREKPRGAGEAVLAREQRHQNKQCFPEH